jgi:enoyl-CoA hydratase/carnithine racemase
MSDQNKINPADTSGKVHLKIDGVIAWVSFDRPAARNAMTWSMYSDLKAICEKLHTDKTIKAVILRGAGGQSFVSGTDIEQFKSFQDGQDGIDYEALIDLHIDALEQLPMPTIAIVDGLAVGGGLAIATACDFRIANPSARFGAPIAKTVGNCLSPTNIARLMAHLGIPTLKRMLLLAELINADELLSSGYIHTVADSAELESIAKAMAEKVMNLAPLTIRSSKLTISRIHQNQLPDCDDLIKACYGSSDFKEGVQAFGEKRPPKWQGS